MKKPWLAAILNFLLPGLGYVYVGKRSAFGIGLVLTSVLLWWGVGIDDMPPITWVDGLITSILLAYDGYNDAVAVNSRKSK